MNEEQLLKTLEGMVSAFVKIHARCDACELTLRVVGQRAGIEPQKIEKLIDRLTDICLQKRLEQVETSDPGLAARIDWRTEFPDLLD